MTTEFLLLRVEEVRTGGDRKLSRWQEVSFHRSFLWPKHLNCYTKIKQYPQKVGSLSIPLACSHPLSSFTPVWPKTSREGLQSSCLDRRYNHLSFLYYSFLQHKNRSSAMITLLLNGNIQYLLHFQINSFLIYFVVIIFPLQRNIKTKRYRWAWQQILV